MEKDEYINSVITNNRAAITMANKDGEIDGVLVPQVRQHSSGDQLSFDFTDDEIIAAELTAVYTPDDEMTTPRWLWADPVIFDKETKRLFMELSPDQRIRFTTDALAKFYATRQEYEYFSKVLVYEKPTELLDLFKSLTIDDFKVCKINNADIRFNILQSNIANAEESIKRKPIDINNLATIWPILTLREMFLESELAALYYLKNPAPQKENATIKRADKIEYPLDKPNHYIWNLLESDTGGQITFDMLPKKPELKAYITYSINFKDLENGVKITKRLTPFDKRVYIAVSALYNAGNEIITLSQIYYAMGNTGRPGQRDLTRINDAITKMRRAEISLDSSDEADELKNYTAFIYDGDLLPMERVTAIINGKLTDGAIKLFREPPLMAFAKDRKQVTTIDIKLLQSPISKTDANLLIDDYLLERIHKEKRAKKGSCTIKLDTIYKYANITTAKQKQRAPEKIEKYLKYYKQSGLFKGYKLSKDKIIITF